MVNEERRKRRYRREQKKELENQKKNIEMEELPNIPIVDEQIELQNSIQEQQNFCDVSIQIDTALTETLCYFIRTEKDLSTMCGIGSFLLLDTIVEILNEIYPNPS